MVSLGSLPPALRPIVLRTRSRLPAHTPCARAQNKKISFIFFILTARRKACELMAEQWILY